MRPSRIPRRRMDSAGSQKVLMAVSRSLNPPRSGGRTPWTRNGVDIGVMACHPSWLRPCGTLQGAGPGGGYACELCVNICCERSVRRALGLGCRVFRN